MADRPITPEEEAVLSAAEDFINASKESNFIIEGRLPDAVRAMQKSRSPLPTDNELYEEAEANYECVDIVDLQRAGAFWIRWFITDISHASLKNFGGLEGNSVDAINGVVDRGQSYVEDLDKRGKNAK